MISLLTLTGVLLFLLRTIYLNFIGADMGICDAPQKLASVCGELGLRTFVFFQPEPDILRYVISSVINLV